MKNSHFAMIIGAVCFAYAASSNAKPPAPQPNPIPVIGKSGEFNIYKIEPKDDLDALKYFSGNTVYQPEDLTTRLPIIEKDKIAANGLRCEYLCADSKGNIVGRIRIYTDGKK